MKALYFDADGTLLTYQRSIGSQYVAVLQEFGLEVCSVQMEASIRSTWKSMQQDYLQSANMYRTSATQEQKFWRNFFTSACEVAGVAEITEDMFQAVYLHFAAVEARPLRKGVVELLSILKNAGYKIGVLSNHDWRVKSILQNVLPVNLLDVVVTAEDAGYKKPAVECFRYAARAIGAEANELLLVGDDYFCDVEGALNAGWQAAWLDESSGTGLPEEVVHLQNLRDLTELLGIELPQ